MTEWIKCKVDQYNMPLYSVQSETPNEPTSQDIGMFPVYQGFTGPCYINGVQVGFQTQKQLFFASYPNIVQNIIQVGLGDGTAGPYTFSIPIINGYGFMLLGAYRTPDYWKPLETYSKKYGKQK